MEIGAAPIALQSQRQRTLDARPRRLVTRPVLVGDDFGADHDPPCVKGIWQPAARYFCASASRPACATAASSCGGPPETPIAPTHLPSTIAGSPPSSAMWRIFTIENRPALSGF